MEPVFEVYDRYKELGITPRKITQGIEFDLVRKFIDYKKNKFKPSNTNNLMVFIEPKINNAYPDVVFVTYDPTRFEDWNPTRRKLTKLDYKLCYHIFTSRRISSDEIVAQLGMSWKDTLKSIERLFDAGVIARERNKWCIRDNRVFAVKKIQAVEAKINKLDKVFQQALVNTNFASESYVLSNIGRNIEVAKIQRYIDFGIGLYSKSNAKFELLSKSKRSVLPASFSSIFFNEWIGKILHGAKGEDVFGNEGGD